MSTITANIPLQHIGPVKIIGPEVNDDISVPLATYETPLWPSTNRGAKVSCLSGGIKTVILDDRMTRSVLLEAPDAVYAAEIINYLRERLSEMQAVVSKTSRYAKLFEFHTQVTGNLLFIRFSYTCGDAAGHNMATNASQHIVDWILSEYPQIQYVSLSGNYCTDKKVSAVNGILGRGKSVVAEILIPHHVVETVLHTTPKKIVDLNIKKNLIGTINAGGVRSANAHFANILLALYGKDLDFVQENLRELGCLEKREPGANARRLAIITAATILCGELSLMAALTNSHELMRAHILFERKKHND